MPVRQLVAGDNVALVEDPVLEQLRVDVTGLGTYLRASDAASNLDADKGAGAVGFRYGLSYVAGTLGLAVATTLGINVTLPPYNADNTGASDASPAVQAAINANPGMPIYQPAGVYRYNSTVAYVSSSSSVFTAGLQLFGDGPDKTIIDSRVAGGAAFNVDTTTTLRFQLYVSIEGLKITTLAGVPPAGSKGIRMRRAYNIRLHSLWVLGLTGDGIEFVVNEGDADACNMISVDRVRIENCASGGNAWGFDFDVTGAFNEASFLHWKHVFIQGCGLDDGGATPPTSGGMRWKGQVAHIDTSAFVINENVGLFIQGGAGLSNTMLLTAAVFENNRRRSLYCSGIDGLRWIGGNIYNNDAYQATVGAEFDGATSVVRGIDIKGVVVRATAGNNAFTAWKISGANVIADTCRVRETIWQNFDHAGQSRFSGWQFDHVPQSCHLVALSGTEIRFRPSLVYGVGNRTPLRLRGAGSTTGEWVSAEVPATTGVSRSNSGLAANTRYYAYLYDNNGALALELTGTAFVQDSATGYNVKSGDATRLFVGSVQTDGASQFLLTGGGWLNPLYVPGSQVGVPSYTWTDSAGRLRVRYAVLPTSDTDGTIVGTQS